MECDLKIVKYCMRSLQGGNVRVVHKALTIGAFLCFLTRLVSKWRYNFVHFFLHNVRNINCFMCWCINLKFFMRVSVSKNNKVNIKHVYRRIKYSFIWHQIVTVIFVCTCITDDQTYIQLYWYIKPKTEHMSLQILIQFPVTVCFELHTY